MRPLVIRFCDLLVPRKYVYRKQLEVLMKLPAHAWPDKVSYPHSWGIELRSSLQDEMVRLMGLL